MQELIRKRPCADDTGHIEIAADFGISAAPESTFRLTLSLTTYFRRGGCTVTATDSSELRVSREVYSMTATRDALWTIRNPVGRMRDLPLRRQIFRPMWFDMAWNA